MRGRRRQMEASLPGPQLSDSVRDQAQVRSIRRPPQSQTTLCAHLLSRDKRPGTRGERVPWDNRDLLCPGGPILSAPAHSGHSVTTNAPLWRMAVPGLPLLGQACFSASLRGQQMPQGPFPEATQ